MDTFLMGKWEWIKTKILRLNNEYMRYPGWKRAIMSTGILTGCCVTYTISSYLYNNIKYGYKPRIDYTVTGDIKNNKGILIFIHGYPDFEYIWKPQVMHFSAKQYCCITLNIPNMNKYKMQHKWGYTLESIIDEMTKTLQQILNDSNNNSDKGIFLIGHDWGSLLCQLLYIHKRNYIKINKLILLDVGFGQNEDPEQLEHSKYFGLFILFWFLPQWMGSILYRHLIKNNYTLIKYNEYPLRLLELQENKSYIHSSAGFPYIYIIKSFIKNPKWVNTLERINEFDKIPILFVDSREPGQPIFNYYSPKFKKWMDDHENCQWETFPCGHWLMHPKVGLSDQLNKIMFDFLQ
mmetsp:Transcript_93316/g.114300  ORF Transcript_93316/g.114300 Transcript_93316/m.114300 type:complete len:349 (+) Transcript_93316:192-1238(+)